MVCGSDAKFTLRLKPSPETVLSTAEPASEAADEVASEAAESVVEPEVAAADEELLPQPTRVERLMAVARASVRTFFIFISLLLLKIFYDNQLCCCIIHCFY